MLSWVLLVNIEVYTMYLCIFFEHIVVILHQRFLKDLHVNLGKFIIDILC